ncbi:MAG: aspartate-alanine antiporter [Muribaculaceae bacterium]|nr:aspartate-alanine antiporter [Muribaculaceae bacterium]
MTGWFVDILREYPPIALFLTIGLGFLIGRIRIGCFQLGSVTSVLLVAVLIGQLEIPVSGPIKQFFFMLFLFSIGYNVGPDFFKSLRGSGARQALFAVCMSFTCFGVTFLISWLFGYTKGETVGLFSGSQTCSSLLGVGSEAIQKLGLPKAALTRELDIIPVCYAVTYIFGTLGTVIILGNLGPRLLGGLESVKRRTAELENRLTRQDDDDPARVSAKREVAYRAYSVSDPWFSGPRTVRDTELRLHRLGLDVYVDRLRHGDVITAPRHDDLIHAGDDIVLCGRMEFMIRAGAYTGEETDDRQLLTYPLTRVGIVVARKDFIGKTISELRRRSFMHGVVVRDARRDGEPIAIGLDTTFRKGDRLTIVGQAGSLDKAAPHIGHVDRPSNASDLMFVGLAIFIGGLFGALSIWVDSVPVSFGTSGGSLIAGIVFGWLRSRRPTFGNIPKGALWVMNNLGLNVFIAVVGIEAAPSFVSGIRTVGPLLFVAGAMATTVPLFVGLWLGHKVFRFNPAITLGCCAGTRTCTAALGAVQNTLGSSLPAIGYTVTYAVSNILLVIWGLVTVMVR